MSDEKPEDAPREDIPVFIVQCPKHGEHEYVICSNIDGHEGVWCQICWIESLGSPFPFRIKGKE